MWVCPTDITPTILDHYNKVFDLPGVSKGAKASVIGKIRDDGQYIVHNDGEEIVNASAKEVTEVFYMIGNLKIQTSLSLNQIFLI